MSGMGEKAGKGEISIGVIDAANLSDLCS